MTVEELRQLCSRGPYVYLTVPRAALPRGTHIRLCGRAGPRGCICTVNKDETGLSVVAAFASAEVMGFLSKEKGEV